MPYLLSCSLMLFLLAVPPASGQERVVSVPEGLLKVAHQKEWKQVQSYLDTSCSADERNRCFIDNNWQLAGPYSEVTFRQMYYIPIDSVEGYYTQFVFHFVLQDQKVIFCRITNASGNNGHVLAEETDTVAFAGLVGQYQELFGRGITVADLFTSSRSSETGSVDRYAERCGLGGTVPAMRLEMQHLLHQRKVVELQNWLSSPVAVKQVYAVEAFYKLKQSGYNLTKEQLRQIRLIQHKHGKITTCSGCSIQLLEISEAAKRFEF